jgi:ssDNA-binding Zn-finger/Zn-ribbon topoisomerase 1
LKSDVIKLIGLGTLLLVMTGAFVPVLVFIVFGAAVVGGIGGVAYLIFKIWDIKRTQGCCEQRQVALVLSDIEVECPNCKSELVAPGNMAGQQVKCEACRTVFPLPKSKFMISDVAMAYSGPPAVSEHPQLSLALLNQMDWKRFEQLTEGYFQKTGWLTRPNRTGADGGVDIHLFRPGESGVAAVVQCKAWSAYMVGVKPVRELLGVMTSDKVQQGFFVTSDTYTDEAFDFAEKNNISLISGCNLIRKIKELPQSDQEALRDLATHGDYLTPTCPSCGRTMVVKTAGKGSRVGGLFWGCPAFPRCRARLQMKRDQELRRVGARGNLHIS